MWKVLKLGDICELITKGTTPTSVGFKFQEEGINFVKIESINDNGKFIKSKFAKISNECHKHLKRSQLAKDDILFSIAGALGYTAIVTSDILPANTNQAIAILRLKKDLEIDKSFLLYWLNSETVKEQTDVNKAGVAQMNLSLSQLKNYIISLPSLAEQKLIVTKLDAAFAEIDKAIQLTEKKIIEIEQFSAQALTSIYFDKKNMSLKKLKEIVSIKGGKRLPKGKKLTTENTGFPYIRVSDFNDDGTINLKSVKFIEANVRKQIERYTISSKDVYVSIAGTIGKTGIVPEILENANLTENAVKLVPQESVDKEFLYFFTKTTSFKKQAIKQTRQAAQPKLALERLGNVEMPLFDLKKQIKIISEARNIILWTKLTKENCYNKIEHLIKLKSSILKQNLQPKKAA